LRVMCALLLDLPNEIDHLDSSTSLRAGTRHTVIPTEPRAKEAQWRDLPCASATRRSSTTPPLDFARGRPGRSG
jgi:hypothetical protein